MFWCAANNYPRAIHASAVNGEVTMMVKKYEDNHNCHRSYKTIEAKVRWIAENFQNVIKTNPDVRVGVIMELLFYRYRVNVDEFRLYMAKNRALQMLEKDHYESFRKMRNYANMILKTNQGS